MRIRYVHSYKIHGTVPGLLQVFILAINIMIWQNSCSFSLLFCRITEYKHNNKYKVVLCKVVKIKTIP